MRKAKINDVTPAKAGVQSEKLDSRFRGNDKYCFRNRNYLSVFFERSQITHEKERDYEEPDKKVAEANNMLEAFSA